MIQCIFKKIDISERIEIPKRLEIALECKMVFALRSLMEQFLFLSNIFKTQHISQVLRKKENEKKFKIKL